MDQVRVLIVDDQPLFRAAARAVVESTDGFEVVATAGSGEEALPLVRTHTPDLVVMDVGLPGMSGLDATRALTAAGEPPVMVVLVSTYDAEELGDEVQQCGAAAYLPKSGFGPDQLEAVWLGRRS